MPPHRASTVSVSELDRRLARVESRLSGFAATLGMLTKGLLALQGQLDLIARRDAAAATVGQRTPRHPGIASHPKFSKKRLHR